MKKAIKHHKVSFKKPAALFLLLTSLAVIFVFYTDSISVRADSKTYDWTQRYTSVNENFTIVASSADGMKLAAASNYSNGHIYTSVNGGSTWTIRTGAGARDWTTITSSSDGTKLAAISTNGGSVVTSTDGGASWTARSLTGWGLTSSSDGMKLAAISNYIHTSTDGGATWVQRTQGPYQAISVASSADGMKLAAVVNNGYVFTSTNGGATWTQRTSAGSRTWSAIASSADGMKLAAANSGGFIYISSDGGATWTSASNQGVWQSLSMSADGSKLIASTNSSSVSISTNSGVSWTNRYFSGSITQTTKGVAVSGDGSKFIVTAQSPYVQISLDDGLSWIVGTPSNYKNFRNITTSSDGTKIAATDFGGYIYTSTNAGSTWIARTSSGMKNWSAITSSSDGTKLAATDGNNGNIFTSSDSGASWTARGGSKYWYDITSSSDGTYLAAVVNGEYIYTSTDSGASWIARTGAGSRSWYAVTSSSDGNKLAAVVDGGYIYTSTNSGATWTARTGGGARNWRDVASSPDGTKLVAVNTGGYIYTSTDSGSTWVARTSAGVKGWGAVTISPDGTRIAAVADYAYISTDKGVTWTQQTALVSSGLDDIVTYGDGTKLAVASRYSGIFTGLDTEAGVCGTANGKTFVNPPTTNLCASSPAPSAVVSNGDYYDWTCPGYNTGTTASCTAINPPPNGFTLVSGAQFPASEFNFDTVDTQKGIVHYKPILYVSAPPLTKSYEPNENITVGGQVSYYNCTNSASFMYVHLWNDVFPDPLNHHQTVNTRNESATCGTDSRLTCYRDDQYLDTFAFSTTATSTPGTHKLFIQAEKKVSTVVTASKTTGFQFYEVHQNGACGDLDGETFASIPADNASYCSVGTKSLWTATATGFTWKCDGDYGGTRSPLCSMTYAGNGACSESQIEDGLYETEAAACDGGTPTEKVLSGTNYTWTCRGVGSGTNASCTTGKNIDAVCGTSAGQTFSVKPSGGLCDFGTLSASGVVTNPHSYDWTCDGVFQGDDQECSAPRDHCAYGGANECSPVTLHDDMKATTLINLGEVCNVSWDDVFITYDADTLCELRDQDNRLISPPGQFNPNTFQGTKTTDKPIKDTIYTLKCFETTDPSYVRTVTSNACRVNFTSKEFN